MVIPIVRRVGIAPIVGGVRSVAVAFVATFVHCASLACRVSIATIVLIVAFVSIVSTRLTPSI